MRLLQTKDKVGAGNVFSVPMPDRRVVNCTSKIYKLSEPTGSGW